MILLFAILIWSIQVWSAYYQTLNCSSNLNLRVKTEDHQIIKVKSDFRRKLLETNEVELYTKQNIKIGVLRPQAGMSAQLEKNLRSHASVKSNNFSLVDLKLKLANSQYYLHCFLDL